MYSFLFGFRRSIFSSSSSTISTFGPTALRARKPTNFDCIFMSLSVRDLLPEIVVLEVPDILPKAMAPTPSTDMERVMVTSARAIVVANAKLAAMTATRAVRSVFLFMLSPDL